MLMLCVLCLEALLEAEEALLFCARVLLLLAT